MTNFLCLFSLPVYPSISPLHPSPPPLPPRTDDVQSFVPLPVNATAAERRWALESHQERRRWELFVQWNEQQGGVFGPTDLVGFGDVDNIPSRMNVYMLKHCELAWAEEEEEGKEEGKEEERKEETGEGEGETEGEAKDAEDRDAKEEAIGGEGESSSRRRRISAVDIATWMAWGTLTRAYKPDHSLPHRTFSYCDPTFWSVEAGMALTAATGGAPNRLRGKAGHFLLGGIHMSDNPFVPFLLAKTIACSECAEAFKAKVPFYRKYLAQREEEEEDGGGGGGIGGGEGGRGRGGGGGTLDSLREFELGLNRYSPQSKDRFLDLETVKEHQLKGLYHLPWFVECFPGRFGGWYGEPDARLRHSREELMVVG